MSKKFIIFQVIFLLLSALLLLTLLPIAGSIDQALLSPYVSATQGFLYKNFWWYDQFAHHDMKVLQEFILLCILGSTIVSKYQVKFISLKNTRQYIQLLIFMLLSILIISILKQNSTHSCPWYMMQVDQSTIHFFNYLGQGKCFPGGHSSLGYAWMAGFFVFYKQDRKIAYFYLFSGLILGTGMGFTQMMRGAHFLSHNLWTFWFTYVVNICLYVLINSPLYHHICRKFYNHQQPL
ncbi:MAG: phosphatase PAP2 family protein [Acinetobacter populi]|jgi:membrane-associated PAP2 superfamily phosphatase|uniref:phosphatase PAP2 family protein n=1 Tax=Acinetobacter populi TaxID=1582270 RepID=UPI002353083A|nr:phosphatase PAP2 family protein [Acinetobacter populi]MCH4248085.1 phosphatase PAP2 family protein [Acinetobacter populi]